MDEIRIKKFTFNNFQENTYVVFNKKGDAYIFDPGNSTPAEDQFLFNYIENNNLTPIALINTHCHIDHILGNKAVLEKYDIPFWAPNGEQMVLESGKVSASMCVIPCKSSPQPQKSIETEHRIGLDGGEWILRAWRGHSPARLALYLP